MSRDRGAEKGQAIVLIALMMAVLVGFTALAIDSARAFDGRRILQASVDAAALAGAEYYQAHPLAWSAAEGVAADQFERDNRIYGSYSCSPASIVPTAGASVNSSMTCTMPAGSNASLTITPTDAGPGGKTFFLSAQRTVSVALMQVLSQSSSITLMATASAVADDLAQTPALAALNPAGCSWVGGSASVNVSAGSTLLTVVGDVVSDGTINLNSDSYAQVSGDVGSRCGITGYPSHLNVTGTIRNGFYVANPQYPAPAPQSSPLPLPVTNAVILPPGLYSSSPFTNANACYFLAGGIFEFPTGFAVGSGLVSNELRPPGEPGYGTPQTMSSDQFWDDYDHTSSLTNHLHCNGNYLPTAIPHGTTYKPLNGGLGGSYTFVITSVRTDGGGYTRESVPSYCQALSVPPSDVAQLVISNVPGATSYNVYTSTNATCPTSTSSSPNYGLGNFSLTTSLILTQSDTELNNALTTCPDTTNSSTCSLGQYRVIYDGNSGLNSAVHPPDPIYSSFPSKFLTPLPGQSPPRSTPTSGDLANENYCGSLGAPVACPTVTNAGAIGTLVTPGAVMLNLTQNSCINVSGGDAYLFSGYQYNWMLDDEAKPSTCSSNLWQGRYNSGLLGLSYTYAAGFSLVGNFGSQTTCFGGVVASTIVVQHATTLALDYSSVCAPKPPGTRLTG